MMRKGNTLYDLDVVFYGKVNLKLICFGFGADKELIQFLIKFK